MSCLMRPRIRYFGATLQTSIFKNCAKLWYLRLLQTRLNVDRQQSEFPKSQSCQEYRGLNENEIILGSMIEFVMLMQ